MSITAKRQKPSVIVKTSKGEKLEEGKDYIASYQSGRKKVGKYEVQISFKGQYSGKKILDFTIRPKRYRCIKSNSKIKRICGSMEQAASADNRLSDSIQRFFKV